MRFNSLPALALRRLALASLLSVGLCGAARADGLAAAPPAPAAEVDPRWSATLDAFAAADLKQAPQPGGVLFVGSSSIRLWTDLETSFADLPVVIKRGFGGSQLLDCVKLVNRLVLPYKPRLVVVYAGENDLAEGASPRQVADRFVALVQSIKNALPAARIAFVSIKPSPMRASMLPAVREANELIRTYSQSEPRLDYIDVHTSMLDDQGKARGDLFLGDRLHLNADGYALWRRIIAQHVKG